MWKPDESLDDYIVRPAPEVTSEPPRSAALKRTGEVEVLKPLTRPGVYPKAVGTAFRASRPSTRRQPLWFRRFLAAGSAALVLIALVLVSAIFVGISDPAAGPDVATNEKPDDMLAQPEEPFSFDVSSPSTFEVATGVVDMVRSNVRRRPARSSIRARLAAYKPRRQPRPLPQPEEPKFFPTTLVIYAENGVINSRIEPWYQTGDKKTPTYNN